MRDGATEIVATAGTFLLILAATAGPFGYEAAARAHPAAPRPRVVTLTGLAATGTWTEREVSGWNYWRATFAAARPILRVGRPVLFRLRSADVIHSFYLPGLGVGPVEVHPGHVVEVLVTPGREGVFGYYCQNVCGEPHFGMRGVVIVEPEAGPRPEAPSLDFGRFWLDPPPRAGEGLVARGRWLFRRKGCFTCHGPAGRGGIPNPNYVKGTVPALDTLADKMFLFEPEDIEALVSQMERRVPLESLTASPPVPRFGAVLAQYHSIRDVIRRGRSPGKKNAEGPDPPLRMPAWEQWLSDEEIDAIIAYLLTLQVRPAARPRHPATGPPPAG